MRFAHVLRRALLVSLLALSPGIILVAQSLDPSSPAKEFIYSGGQLVAVELYGSGGGGGPNPVVTITAPADSSTHTGADVDLTYTATDDVAVTKCEFQVDSGPAMEYTTCVGTTLSYTHLTDTAKFLAYDFAEGVATAAQDRAADAENNDGTINGPTATTSPDHGTAIHFDGTNDSISPASPNPGVLHNSFGSRSFEAWFKADSTAGAQTIYDEGGYWNGFFVGINAGNLRFTTQNGNTGPKRIDHPFTDTTGWHHVAATFDSGTMKLYLDGVQVQSSLSTGFSTVGTHGDEPQIGRTTGNDADEYLGEAHHFSGDLDEIAVYTDVLSATEIADHAANDYFSGSTVLKVTAYDADTNTGSDQATITIN